jgi:hypothetical protein
VLLDPRPARPTDATASSYFGTPASPAAVGSKRAASADPAGAGIGHRIGTDGHTIEEVADVLVARAVWSAQRCGELLPLGLQRNG